MQKIMVVAGFFLVVSLMSGCASEPRGVESSLLDIAVVGEGKESNTALLLLSKTSLSDLTLEKLAMLSEQDQPYTKRVYLSYVIAKRTQFWPDIERFIDIVSEDPSYIINSENSVIGPNNDLMSLLSYYSNKSDKALSILIQLVPYADGAVLEQLSGALHLAERDDAARFYNLVNVTGADEAFIKQLIMED